MLKCRMCFQVTSKLFSQCEKFCSAECSRTYNRLAEQRGGYHVLERDLYIIELKKMVAELMIQNQELVGELLALNPEIISATAPMRVPDLDN